ncbi:MAG: DNA glycosylase [Eubacteriales bacterium]|nr:DNA glycosylase [Eubacteriales bacterium]
MLIFKNIIPFSLEQTFDCGQCFRWDVQEDGSYIGFVGKHIAKINYINGDIVIDSNCEDELFWKSYLDIDRDYLQIINDLSADDIMKNAISYGEGIRLLKQDPWETVVSFIISQNNNIPRIKKIIGLLCENFGDKVTFNGETYYSFPTPEQIYNKDLSVIRAGFRDKYILSAASMVVEGIIDFNLVYNMDYDTALEYLKQIKGVGNKVADCVILFAFQKFESFPKDVWIKRTMSQLYNVAEEEIEIFAKQKFKGNCGFAQQYLFYSARQDI